MAYCVPDPGTKKRLKESFRDVAYEVFECTPFGDVPVKDGFAVLEMPHHYHRWYAQVQVEAGRIISVK